MKKMKQKIKKKIVAITILAIMLMGTIMPTFSQADWGGILISPFTALIAAVGDIANNLINYTLAGNVDVGDSNDAYLGINDDENKKYAIQNTHAYIDDDSFTLKTINASDIQGECGVPNLKVSLLDIFSNNVALLDPNYFNDESVSENKIGGQDITDAETGRVLSTSKSTVSILKTTIASWYNSLRMVAIVGLLSVLVYVGIRIIISSAATDQSKYKSMLVDWLIALCLIFALHYIMVFTMTVVEQITNNLVNTTNSSESKTKAELNILIKDTDSKKAVDTLGVGQLVYAGSPESGADDSQYTQLDNYMNNNVSDGIEFSSNLVRICKIND